MTICNSCKKSVSAEAKTCPNCGQPSPQLARQAPLGTISAKSRTATALFCFFFGVLGVHRFFVGKVGTGIAQLLTLGGLGIWSLVDLILIIAGIFKDKEGRVIAKW